MEKNATEISNLANLATSLVANDYLIIVRNANSALPDRVTMKIAAGNAFPQLFGGNISVNSVVVGSNIKINTSSLLIGNSSVNVSLNSTALSFDGTPGITVNVVVGSNTLVFSAGLLTQVV